MRNMRQWNLCDFTKSVMIGNLKAGERVGGFVWTPRNTGKHLHT